MAKNLYDFSGYVTKNDILCTDGRIIRHNAFAHNDGGRVPLVWNHQHNDPFNVIGHVDLENRDDGVYGYGSLNDSPQGVASKAMIRHGDINAMSIFANKLKQQGPNVIHGDIIEVSLVLSGANKGAFIDDVYMAHGDESESESVAFFEAPFLCHADEDESEEEKTDETEEDKSDDTSEEDKSEESEEPKKDEESEEDSEEKDEDMSDTIKHADAENQNESDETIQDVFNTLTEKQKKVVYYMLDAVANGGDEESSEDDSDEDVKHADDGGTGSADSAPDDATIQEIFDTLTDQQKQVVYFLVGSAANMAEDDNEEAGKDVQHSGMNEGETFMKHNVFDNDEAYEGEVLSHSEMTSILEDAQSVGSLKQAFLQHGISNIDVLYPEAQAVSTTPEMISRKMEWVSKVWNATKKTPFARIKSLAANVTADEARAKGYVKGDKKVDEVIDMLSRETTPQTVYKKQSFDRDDLVDITDLDVVSWIRSEMRMMLDEEIARAILVGDGRTSSATDKIKEGNIRPVYTDSDVYTIKTAVAFTSTMDETDKSNAIVKAALKSRKDYLGSGNLAFYASNDVITDLLLATDKMGRRLYNSEAELAAALRVKEIIEVPVLESQTRTENSKTYELLGLIVDLSDYAVGTDRGGEVNMFDDFDINYNKEQYLIETRMSGALVKPYSAIALEKDVTAAG